MYTLESTGAQLSLDNALPYLYQLHQATRECQSYDLGPVFEARPHVNDEENTGGKMGLGWGSNLVSREDGEAGLTIPWDLIVMSGG